MKVDRCAVAHTLGLTLLSAAFVASSQAVAVELNSLRCVFVAVQENVP
jgi:hypothetical protein